VEEDDSFERYRYLIKKKTDDFVAEKKLKFKDHLVQMENLVEIYFDAVRAAFEARLKIHI